MFILIAVKWSPLGYISREPPVLKAPVILQIYQEGQCPASSGAVSAWMVTPLHQSPAQPGCEASPPGPPHSHSHDPLSQQLHWYQDHCQLPETRSNFLNKDHQDGAF